jgi:type 1 glutamine amidotransferase
MKALVVRGGWEGHVPIAATDRYIAVLREAGYEVTPSESLDSYLDAEALAGTDLIVQCWTMGTITADQLAGLSAAVHAGTGFAGWHGGVIDAFRSEPGYHFLTGGQFVHHPKEFVEYEVRWAPGRADHRVVAGLSPFSVTTELYHVHVDPAVEILAVTGAAMPVTWLREWGAGRVFVTTIGHTMADLEVPEVHAMITRGMAWAAR